jgi:predicted nuclease with RNAse H fold
MIAGVILSDSLEEDSKVAFLGDELSVFSVETNEDIVDLFDEFKPEVVAFDVGTAQSGKEFTKAEKDMKEEGFIFTPNSFQKDKVERLQSLEKFTKHRLSYLPDFIRFEPQISAEELKITSESDLESFGISGDIGGAKEFDAVLGAVTARFYEQGDFEEMGVVIPGDGKNT